MWHVLVLCLVLVTSFSSAALADLPETPSTPGDEPYCLCVCRDANSQPLCRRKPHYDVVGRRWSCFESNLPQNEFGASVDVEMLFKSTCSDAGDRLPDGGCQGYQLTINAPPGDTSLNGGYVSGTWSCRNGWSTPSTLGDTTGGFGIYDPIQPGVTPPLPVAPAPRPAPPPLAPSPTPVPPRNK